MDNLDVLNNKIEEYSDKHTKLVVGIDGYTGIGKTSLLNDLVRRNKNILPIYKDDFNKPRAVTKKLLDESNDRSKIMELQWCEHEKIIDLISKYKRSDQLFTTQILCVREKKKMSRF